MKISYRSVPIMWRTIEGNTSQTAFNISDVRSHELEIGFMALLFRRRPFWVGLFIWGVIVFVLGYAFEYDVRNFGSLADFVAYNQIVSPFFHLGVWLSLPFTIWVAYGMAKESAMLQHARRERGDANDSRLKVVEEKDWAYFRSRLR